MTVYFDKLKRFNEGVNVWAVPHRGTEEAKMLDRGQRFGYTLLKERFPDLHKSLTQHHQNKTQGYVKKQVKAIESKIGKNKK
jgi:hypothetical protein